MSLSRRTLLSLAAAPLLGRPAFAAAAAPAPFGPVPSPRQLRWHGMERYAFVHFTLNSFTDKEWGYGDESPALFDPSDFDADQIVRSAKEGGLRAVIVTAKHHDGFCLWPSRFTEHSVKYSPFRGGRGDVLREVSDACRRQGLEFGVYLSPWDRHHPDYGRPAYITYYRNQLRELMSAYGPIFEVWFDGANGGDGFYGGARETRRIPPDYYDWPGTWRIVRDLQPDTVIWSDAPGADVRWCGNEEGFVRDPCWATMRALGTASTLESEQGVRGGSVWWPAEVDVSLRPGWFWHASEDDQVKSPARLMRLYDESVGRGANLILNLPPDRRGRIPDRDAANLRLWQEALSAGFATDLARGAVASASNVRGGLAGFAAGNVLDGKADSYWATDDDVVTADLVLDFGAPRVFDRVRLREFLPLGQRVGDFALDVWETGAWREAVRGSAIGPQKLVRMPRPMTAVKLRLRIETAAACPAIAEMALFLFSGSAHSL